MKKFLKTGKKTLSVFMAVLMAFTALVFAAPQKVSAVSEGKYDVRVTIYVTDRGDYDGAIALNSYKCYGIKSTDSVPSKGSNTAGITLKYSSNNGTGSSTTVPMCLGCSSHAVVTDKHGTNNVDEYKFPTFKNVGFPEELTFVNEAGYTDGCGWTIQKIEVAPAGTDEYRSIWEGNVKSQSTGGRYAGHINATEEKWDQDGNRGKCSATRSKSDWTKPTPTKIDWIDPDGIVKDLTISAETDSKERDIRYNILDQYGVAMSTTALSRLDATPSVTVSASTFGSVGTAASANLYYNSGYTASENYVKITAKPGLKSSTSGINSYETTVQVSAGSLNESKTFTIYDPKYTVFFDANGGDALNPALTQVYYGESLASQAKLDGTSNYPTSGTYAGHSFLGLFDAKTGGNKMDPNEAVTATKTYYAHWDAKTYVVVFLDKEGKCVDIQYVGYGKKVNDADARAEIDKEKYPTSDKHFTFKNWDQDISKVSSNMIVNAVYDEAVHTFDAGVDVEANCQHAAGTEYTCTVCGYKKVTETSSVKGDHTLTGLIQDVAPTCTEEGKGHKECTVCGEKLEADTPIPALGHSYKISVIKEATCTEEGTRNLTCTRCGAEETELIPKTQHNYEKTETVAATCNSSGYDVMRCSACGDEYNKYLGAASNEHSWSESYDKATGVLTLTCSVCGTVKTVDIGANLTDFVSATVTTEPTCKADGVVTVTAGDDTFTVTIKKETIPHNYTTEFTPATCEKDGKIVNVCSVCGHGDEANAKVVSKLGHDLKEEITKPATCLVNGVKTISCKRDGCTYSTTEVIPATGHKAVSVVTDCTSGGTVTCSVCKTVLAKIPAKEHDYSGTVRETPATCSENGIKYTKCKTCNAEKAELLPKLEHSYSDNWVTVVPAGCTTEGVEKRTCNKDCGAFEIRKTGVIGHKTKTDTDSATCTEAGSKVTRCTNVIGGVHCDYEKTEIIQPLGHDLGEPVVHPQDCLAGAYEKRACQRKDCSYTEVTFTGESSGLGHDFSEEVTVKEATCEEDGSKIMKCSRCDETETVVIPKLGHNFVAADTVPASCTTSGYTVMKCNNDRCTKTYNEYDAEKPALGHDWGEWTIKTASTNTEKGKMIRSCKRGCGATETAEIPAGGHSFTGATGEVVTAATCHSEGETKYTCTAHTDCGVSITVETAKTPHTLRTKVTYAKCERIYNEDGTYKDVFTPGKVEVYCSNSGCTYVDATATIILPISGHSWGDWQTHTAATCKSDGLLVRYCKSCGAKDEKVITERPAHKFVATVVAPTCTDRGFTTYACEGCGLTYRDDFTDALGHAYDEGVVVEATCTTPGGIKYTCTREFDSEKIVDGKKVIEKVPCGHVKFVEDESKPATGHNMGDWKYVEHPTKEANAYAKERICLNPGCTFSEYETGAGEDHEIDGVNAYYKVTFYNEWVTDTYDVLESHRIYANPGEEPVYTKLAKTYKTVELASIYVLKNTEAVYPLKTNPKREKDVNWGGYYFEGWTEKGQNAVGKDAVSNPLDLSKITANTDLYALFKCRDVYYKVRFYNADGTPLTKETVILHGHSAEWPESFGTPQMKDDITWKYEFKRWAYDYTKIYDDVSIMAIYDSIAKIYHLEYYDENGNLLATEDVTNGQKLTKVPKIEPKEKEDKKYIYIFNDTWTLANGKSIDTENFAVPLGSEEGDTIKVYAKYSKRQKIYPVKLHIVDPYDASAPLEGVTVEVMDNKGQLTAKGETDANGDVTFSLYYDQYTFSATRGNYYFNGIMSFDEGVAGNAIRKMFGSNDYQGTIRLEVKENPNEGEKCGCICHTFFGGFWITFLNILYKVFGIRHVCCYDMFAVHGDKLAYGKS